MIRPALGAASRWSIYLPGEVLFGPGRYLLDDTMNEIPTYGGIFRGRPITFNVHLVAPDAPGTYLTHWSMVQEHVTWFGELLNLAIKVTPKGDYNADGAVDAADFVVFRNTFGQSGTGLAADGNNNNLIDAGDYRLWRANFGQTAGSSSSADINGAVPEPTLLVLLISGILAICSQLRAKE